LLSGFCGLLCRAEFVPGLRRSKSDETGAGLLLSGRYGFRIRIEPAKGRQSWEFLKSTLSMEMVNEFLYQAIIEAEQGQDLPEELMYRAMVAILRPETPDEAISRLLLALARKGESASEIAGAARALREVMIRVRSDHPVVLDVVGTGGDRSGTFNLSTAVAVVTAAAGVPVAKHGNRAVTSRSGSADVLQQLGLNLEAPLPVVEACLQYLGICFCFAPRFHPAMKRVAPIRQRLGMATIFNILGPLLNPAGAAYQLLGVGRPDLRPKLAEVLARLGTRRTWVVHGAQGLDELGLLGENWVSEVVPQGIREFSLTAEDFGLPEVDPREVVVANAEESARMIRQVLTGMEGPARYLVLANAAAALVIAGQARQLAEGVMLAAAAIDSGRAERLLKGWIACSQATSAEEVRQRAPEYRAG
jgi:anthranilate phosphoribosyltransferase